MDSKNILPSQAVLLCGGLGTRLKPFTDNLPKPMVGVNGKPFLYYLLCQLSDQGINSFVLLTGYLSEKIVDYFGDGSKFGWKITYSHGPIEWETGRRLWEARKYIDSVFLLLYSDNFVNVNLQKLVYKQSIDNKVLTLLLCSKSNGNIKLDAEGNISSYLKKRDQSDHNYVEVGYMLVNKDRLFEQYGQISGAPNFNLSILLERLAARGEISGLISYEGYRSISDPDRLVDTQKFLSPKKYILIDRDGTINQKAEAGQYITDWKKFNWISDSVNALKELASNGFEFIIITNQAGVSRGMMSGVAVENIHENMIQALQVEGVRVVKVVACYDHWDDNSFRRKPAPGMFFEVAKEFNFRLDHVLYVGDDVRDCEAAWNAGCGMVYITENKDPPCLLNFPYPYIQVNKFSQAVDQILKIYSDWELS